MATQYPAALDSFTNPTSSSYLTNPSHSEQHSNLNDAVEAIQTTLGVTGSTDPATVTGRLGKTSVASGGTHVGEGSLNFVSNGGSGFTITDVGGVMTVSPIVPQDLVTGASPSFYGLSLSGFSTPTGKILYLGATGQLQAGNALVLSGSQLQLSGQSSTGGILIGLDTQIYRSAADVLRTPDTLIVDGGLAVGQTSTTAKATIGQTDGVNYALNVRHTGGTITRNGLWIETTGTSSSTTALRVQTGSATDAVVTDGSGMTGLGLVPSGSHRLQVKGSGNTSATDAVRVTNSDGTYIFQVANNGYIAMGSASTTSKLTVNNTATDTTIGGVQSAVTFTGNDATSRTNYGILASLTSTTNVTANHVAIAGQYSLVPVVGSGAVNNGNNSGLTSTASISSAAHRGTLTNMYAAYMRHGATSTATGGGSVTNSWGMYVLTDFSAPVGLTIGTSYGLQIAGTGSSSYPTTLWGVHENYAAAAGAANYFSSPVLIGNTSRGANLSISRANTTAAWGTNGVNIRGGSVVYTDSNTASGTTASSNAVNSLSGGTLAAANANVTYTNAYNLFLGFAPIAGTNVTITNPWTLWINSGATRLLNTFLCGSSYSTNTNANLLSGSTFNGLQIRNTASVLPAIEMYVDSNAIADGATLGKVAWFAGTTTPRENAKIEALQIGTNEDAARILFSTATGGTLTERMRIESTGRTVVQSLNVPNSSTPASATATGTKGDMTYDDYYFYVCTGTNQWARFAKAAW